MSLLKLWNSLCGRSNVPEQPLDQSGQPLDQSGQLVDSDQPKVSEFPAQRTKKTTRKSTKKPKPASRGILGIGGRNPHAALCKLVRPISASTVLEISVGDGSRAAAVVRTLAASNENVRYAAIDQFELSGGQLTLKEFHQSLRGENVRAQLFPETIERGLVRVASTIGAIDLVLIAAETETWQTATVLAILPRLLHANSVVLYRSDDDSWSRYQPAAGQLRRAA